ncbi:MAG: hypothetical protein DLM73_08960 [Chthoniobacterales bacterium]|nr:MAG: hypothetical protein DLM73_08960 [Chthoniobacterales bacterium]
MASLAWELSGTAPAWLQTNHLWFLCGVSGGFGGCLYCLRGVYLNACVRKNWDAEWEPWYYIRPFASLLSGGVSCLFLKAGLLILEAGEKANATQLGFYAFAFVAGLNVDKFVAKIEDIAQATWGIEKSRAGREESK